jgi:aminoglycoside 6-adenylyltransferase
LQFAPTRQAEFVICDHTIDTVIRFECLEVILRWRIGLDHGWTVNPGKLGRGFKRYLDPATWAELEATYAPADPAANWAALDNTIVLFRRLAHELAAALDFHYPAGLDQQAAAHVQSIAELPEDG